ncbi:MAG: DUF1700 domain-containing protein [Marinisporobacter sp.]|nr:DUF1700 domain-containing protein [Marinisporobacter sp.]
MNKSDYLKKLEELLKKLSKEEREEILMDYEEHFTFALEEGKTEDEIIKDLGNPDEIAKQYIANSVIHQATENPSFSNIVRAVFTIVALGFFNIVFVLGPFLGVSGALVGLFAGAIGVFIAGISLFGGIVLKPLLGSLVSMPIVMTSNPLATIFLGIGVTALGILFFIGNCYLTKWLYKLTLKYLKMNLKIIKK